VTAQIHRLAVITHAGQSLQDAAISGSLRAVTLGAQGIELDLQTLEFFNALGHMADMLVQQGIDLAAVLLRCIPELQQTAHFIERHIERAAMADELQPFHMLLAIHAVISLGPGGRRQQCLTLVIADGFRRAIGSCGKFADLQCVVRGVWL